MRIIKTGSEVFPWGKALIDKGTGNVLACLPLTSHCLAVAAVFRELLRLSCNRNRLQTAAGCLLSDAQLDRLAVLALLHDIGKTNLGFQDKIFDAHAPRAGHIREIAPLLFESDLNDQIIEALRVETLASWFLNPKALSSFLLASWSHHGKPIRYDPADVTGTYYLAKTKWWGCDGSRDPMRAMEDLMGASRATFPAAFQNSVPALPECPAFQHRFAGLVMLSDWIGSHELFFPIATPVSDPFLAARRALSSLGLQASPFQEALTAHPEAFETRFGFSPHPLQDALDALPADYAGGRLLIAEAETGSGKTEAALARFFNLFAAGQVDALYFALPTRVAARELYFRVWKNVRRIFPDAASRPRVVLAVPGYARVDNVPIASILPQGETRWDDEDAMRLQEQIWAAERPKRFLASTIAVGTIDQALLSTVQTPHAHLRSVCLDRSLLVVDEVHASDTYMRFLLKRLLKHHVGLGGHALLLSATLGAVARTEFLAAVGTDTQVPDFPAACTYPYPALTDHKGNSLSLVGPAVLRERNVRFELQPWLLRPELAVPEIASALADGARVLVVLNTVGRAIALQRALENDSAILLSTFFQVNGVRCPHHGRFAPSDREILDQIVSCRWGKHAVPGALVLVGTQTLEQSLDIDADLLVTDLCPADVLLQRVGRLHRHSRERPAGFEQPRCVVLSPDVEDLEAFLDENGAAVRAVRSAGLGSVYEDLRIIALTWSMLSQVPDVHIPSDNRGLVEGATHPERLATLAGPRWELHAQGVEGAATARNIAAHLVAIDYEKPLDEMVFPADLGERASTRLGLGNLRVPLTEQVGGPFGVLLSEVILPAHMVPPAPYPEAAEVLNVKDGTITLQFGSKTYTYSRFGLEGRHEPAR